MTASYPYRPLRFRWFSILALTVALLWLPAAPTVEAAAPSLTRTAYLTAMADVLGDYSAAADDVAALAQQLVDDPTLIQSRTTKTQFRTAILNLRAALVPIYTIVPPSSLLETHLLAVAFAGYNDYAMTLLERFVNTGDPALIQEASAVMDNAVIALDTYIATLGF